MTSLVPPPPRPPLFTRPPTTAPPTIHTCLPTSTTPSLSAGGGAKGGPKTGSKSGPKPVFPGTPQQGGDAKKFAMTIIPLGVNKDGAKTLRDRLLGKYMIMYTIILYVIQTTLYRCVCV